MKITAWMIGALLGAGVLSGCAVTPPTIVQHPVTARPQAPAPQAADGAIFQTASYRPMFEDHRARMVGDLLTIAIVEKTNAVAATGTSSSKNGAVNAAVPQLFGVPAAAVGKLGVSATNSNKLDEKDARSASNSFSGTIGVTVTEVLPNGNLVVSGEKQIAFDKGSEFVRFSGVVSPDTIGNGNIVSSTQVADARVEYRTNTHLDRADMMSVLTRFFLSVVPL